MTLRILFLGEGSSDGGLTVHLDWLAAKADVDIVVTAPDLTRLRPPPGRSVADKLRAVCDLGGDYDLVLVHRDADNAGPSPRRSEVESAIALCMPGVRHVAVVPVRMTEAWLLLDERLLRRVAGNPNGGVALHLPSAREVETVANPKDRLRQVLAVASELRGRRLEAFKQRFGHVRRQLLERLDPEGPIGTVPSWMQFVDDVASALRDLRTSPPKGGVDE